MFFFSTEDCHRHYNFTPASLKVGSVEFFQQSVLHRFISCHDGWSWNILEYLTLQFIRVQLAGCSFLLPCLCYQIRLTLVLICSFKLIFSHGPPGSPCKNSFFETANANYWTEVSLHSYRHSYSFTALMFLLRAVYLLSTGSWEMDTFYF